LAALGRRLSAIAVNGVELGRLGGDAFGVLISGSHAAERLDDVARLIHEQIGRSILVDGVEMKVRLSIGFALGDGRSIPLSSCDEPTWRSVKRSR
jgi:GGDEF domain-containing protein